jgi:hypothetical protein
LDSELTSWTLLCAFNLSLNGIKVAFWTFNRLVILKWTIISDRTYDAFKSTSNRIITHFAWSYIRSRNTLMSAFPSCSTFNGYTCACRTEISISKFYQLISMRTFIMFWTFITVCLISQRVCSWCTSFHHCLISEWTKEPLGTVLTFNGSHLRESSIKTLKYSDSCWIWAHKS